jgi:drug/metabolite transporter (DMT)-like permease
MLQRSRSVGGVVGVLAGATAIATAPMFAVLAHDWSQLSPTVTAMWRTGLAAPILWGLLLWREGGLLSRPEGTPVWTIWFLLPGLCFAGDLGSWHASMTIIAAGTATFLANLAVIMVPIVAWLWFKERPPKPFFIGAVVAISGAALLLVPPGRGVLQTLPGSGANYVWGNALGVLTAVWYGAYQLSTKRARDFGSTLRVMTWSTAVCSVVLLVVALGMDEPLWPRSPRGWYPLFGMALFAQTLGQGLIAWSLGRIPASYVSVGLLWQPVAASLLGYVVLGQTLSAAQIMGMLVVLAGLFLATRTKLGAYRRRQAP